LKITKITTGRHRRRTATAANKQHDAHEFLGHARCVGAGCRGRWENRITHPNCH
jgi:hypothetical protein